jgi:hypothetical protein
MGGSVSVTIREADGTEHRMVRWTNAFPEVVDHLRFLKKDPEYLSDYNDGPPTLAPDGYGLIVLDHQKDTVLSMQGYSHFEGMHNSALWVAANSYMVSCGVGARNPMDAVEKGEITFEEHIEILRNADSCNYAVAFADLFQEGRIKTVATSGDWYGLKELPLDDMSLEEIVEKYILHTDDPKHERVIAFFKVDRQPFMFKRYEEDSEGAKQMHGDILGLGFKLSEQEETLWAEWITREKEEEDWEDDEEWEDGED